jgi:predicted nucleic acid-binding protein
MIFIDTGAFVARHIERDQHHQAAVDYWAEMARGKLRCATSSFVLDETFTLLGRLAGNAFAAERARNIYASPSLKILRPDAATEMRALEFFTKYADKKISFTDAISFALMRKERIRRAFTFDRHFSDAGFQVCPPQH